MIGKVGIGMLAVLLLLNCSSSQDKQSSYEEIEFYQESSLLFDFLNYYKEDFGEYPNDLQQLIKLFKDDTDYSGVTKSNIKSNITDPFSGMNYKYVLINDNSFILYSVGPDGLDDNTDIINEFMKSGKVVFRHFDRDVSKGDILIHHLENGEVVNDFTDVSNWK